MPNLFSLSVSSMLSTYSADFQNLSANYISNLGTFTSDGTTFASITGAKAPYTSVKITPLGLGTNLWANNIDWIKFFFNDVYNPVTIQMTPAAFAATGITHIFGPPRNYPIRMTAHNAVTSQPLSAFNIATVNIGEIAAKPAFSVFEADGTPVTFNTSVYSPYTLQFAATGTRAGSYPIETLTWNFDDGPQKTITLYETEPAAFDFLELFSDIRDPRNYLVTHTYNRNVQTQDVLFRPQLITRSMVTATTAVSGTPFVGPVQLAQAETRRLIKSKLFGPRNSLLLISENDKGQVFQHVIERLF